MTRKLTGVELFEGVEGGGSLSESYNIWKAVRAHRGRVEASSKERCSGTEITRPPSVTTYSANAPPNSLLNAETKDEHTQPRSDGKT
jgi:hypothetical protein